MEAFNDKFNKEKVLQIREAFHSLNDKEDLLNLLNLANKILYGDKAFKFSMKHFMYYANPDISHSDTQKNRKNILSKIRYLIKKKWKETLSAKSSQSRGSRRYKTFEIPKKTGGKRLIHAPQKNLMLMLQSLNYILQCMCEPHKAAIGFVPLKSIIDNAKPHVNKIYVFNIDLKDFFHSFDLNQVKMALMNEPFNLREDREPLAFLLASLCTHPIEVNGKIKRVLPQGSPTSPTLTNILCRRLDKRLNGLAKRFRATYTRYADDITFSSNQNIFEVIPQPQKNAEGFFDDFYPELIRILSVEKLTINPQKIRLQFTHYRQSATGILVNEKLNVRREFVKRLRMWIYYWETYGYEKAEEIFQKYCEEKKLTLKSLKNTIQGQLVFMKMVKGEEDSTYQKLYERYLGLIGKVPNNPTNKKSTSKPLTTQNRNTPTKEPANILTDRKENTKNEKNDYAIVHTPKRTVEILKKFSDNNCDLKYTTHSWTHGRFESYDDFMRKIRKEWKEIKDELKDLNERLYAKINNFLFNKSLGKEKKNGKYKQNWGDKQLHFGWSSPELKNFCNKNPNQSPLDCTIPDEIKELDKNYGYSTFRDYVNVFKNEIEFREDTKRLFKLFMDKKKGLKKDLDIEPINLNSKFFYTDVAYIHKTIDIIFEESFLVRKEHREIEAELHSKDGDSFCLLTLTQKNSHCVRNLEEMKKKANSGSMGTICHYLKNLADFSICADFPDGKAYRVHYLVSDKNQKQVEELETNPYGGFTFELKFYL